MIRLPVVRSTAKPDGRLGRQWAGGSGQCTRLQDCRYLNTVLVRRSVAGPARLAHTSDAPVSPSAPAAGRYAGYVGFAI
jgi:hypothetical protein